MGPYLTLYMPETKGSRTGCVQVGHFLMRLRENSETLLAGQLLFLHSCGIC